MEKNKWEALVKFITIVLGLQWGDEGKGKLLLKLLEGFDAILRFNGGHNAGHSLEADGVKFVSHILPSGALAPGKECWIGGNVLVNPIQLKKEIIELESKGAQFKITNRLYLDFRAILASPFDCFIDSAEEAIKARSGTKVGTTGRGIGPGYMYDTSRNGLRLGSLLLPGFKQKCRRHFDYQRNLLIHFYSEYGYVYSNDTLNAAEAEWMEAVSFIDTKWICNLTDRAYEFAEAGKKILAEGAQAYMLDRVLGDYPNVTSSNTTTAALLISLGLPHTVIKEVWGVAKPYATKVGEGYFPSEMDEKTAEIFRKAGNEYGASTGRPRRIGHLDMQLLMEAIRATGVTKVFFAKADICPVPKMKIVTGYNKKYLSLSEIGKKDLSVKNFTGWGDWKPEQDHMKNQNLNMFFNEVESMFATNLGPEVRIAGYGTGPDRDAIILL